MESGTKLGHYEIGTLLGKGGMGEVWRAREVSVMRFCYSLGDVGGEVRGISGLNMVRQLLQHGPCRRTGAMSTRVAATCRRAEDVFVTEPSRGC